jgi:hypothetical protein
VPETNFKTSSAQIMHLPEKFRSVCLPDDIAFVHRGVQHIPFCLGSKLTATGNSYLRMMVYASPNKACMVQELMRSDKWMEFCKNCVDV